MDFPCTTTTTITNDDDEEERRRNSIIIPNDEVVKLLLQKERETMEQILEQKIRLEREEMKQTIKDETEIKITKLIKEVSEEHEKTVRRMEEERTVMKEELADMNRQMNEYQAQTKVIIEETAQHLTDRLESTITTPTTTTTTTESSSSIPLSSGGDTTKLPEDTYSLILCYETTNLAFWLGVVVFGIQTTLFILVGSNQLGGRKGTNWLKIPENVDLNVRVTQFLAIIIAIVFQDDFITFIERHKEGYHNELKSAFSTTTTISYEKWIFSNLLRAIQGFFGLIVALLLIVQSDYVFDLLLNFTGLVFLSQLDDLVFRLVKKGFFGETLEINANLIADTKYNMPTTTKAHSKRFHARFLIFAGSIVYMGFFTIFFMQRRGRFMCESIYIKFNDPELPFLETYAGVYTFIHKKRDRYRLCVEDRGGNDDETLGVQKGRFAFCKEESIWAFSIEQGSNGGDPCENYLASTPADSSFDLLGTDSQTWVKKNGDPMERNQLICASEESQQQQPQCGKGSSSSDCGRTCRVLRYEGTNIFSSPIGWDDDFAILNDGNASRAYDHPVFMRERNSTNYSFDLLVFTGTRWVFTQYNNTREELIVMFGGNNNFHASQLKSRSVMLLSEAVDPFTDPFTPQGLRWYRANYANASSGQEFPVTDFQRPVDVEFSCRTCDNITNPCRHGDCHADGVCDCRHRTKGDLCEIEPLGDGFCDDFFNNEAYQYDGGDCCRSTCQGFSCSEYWTTGVFEFVGFPNCKDPETVPLTIHFDLEFYLYGEESWSLVCDGISYFSVVCDGTDNFTRFDEAISWVRVEDGSNCTVQDNSSNNFGTEIVLRNGTTVQQRFNNSQPEFIVVSTCLLKDIVKYFPVMDLDLLGYDDTVEGKAVNILNQYVSEVFTCGNPLFKQQYAMAVLSAHGWLPSAPHCQWDTNLVGCQNGAVIDLLLSSNATEIFLDGTVPSEIGLLSDLELLDLSDHFFTGRLPTELGRLTNLVALVVTTNEFTGSLPSELGLLTNLEYLDLSENGFIGSLPSELGNLAKLSYLDLKENGFMGNLPSQLGMLIDLELLYCDENIGN